MKKLLMMLAAVGIVFTACEGGGIEEENGGASMPKIELSQQSIEVDFEPNTYTVSVTSPYYWKAESDNDWIVVESEKGDAGTEELSFKVERNEEENERKGSVFIYNSPYNLVAELNVTQKAFEPNISIEPKTLNFTIEESSQDVTITANFDNFEYDVTIDANWVKCSNQTKEGITITVPDYAEVEERTADIVISNKKYNISKTIKVTQTGLSEEDYARLCIIYTSLDEKVVTPYKTDVFGANIVSNIYENGKGVIKFDAPVTSIGNYAFKRCDSLTSVTIGNSVTSIGNQAFYDCSSLTSITIPDSVTSIEYQAFYGCSSLTSATIPDSVTSIGDNTFSGCSSLISATIGNSVTSIGKSAFSGCSSLTSITIPDSVASIESGAFRNCSNLTAFYGKFVSADNRCLIIDGVLKAFAPAGLTSYTIPDSVTSIGDYAFYKCSSLTSITIGNSVTSIGEYAFLSCSSLTAFYGKFASADNRCLIIDGILKAFAPAGLTSYTIPDSVTSIGGGAFYDCSSLTSVTIPNSVTSIGEEAFGSCSSLTSITIPDSVTSIEARAFSGCSSLISIIIPDSITEIGVALFRDCSSLTSITIPDSVTKIRSLAFSGCSSLTSVYCKATTPPKGLDPVFYNNTSLKIYVPTASVEAYKSASYWSNYADYIVGYDF